MNVKDMIVKLEDAKVLLQQVYAACNDDLVNQFSIEDHINDATSSIDDTLNLLQIELI